MFRSFIFTILLFTSMNCFSQGSYKIETNEVVLSEKISFKTGSSFLLPESDAALNIIKKYLEEKTYISTLRIEGHVTGTKENQELSEARALAICKWLVKNGIDCKRLVAVGFGSTKPVADNSTPEGRAANTRISFYNAALRGHLIGGMPADGGGNIAGDCCE